MISDIFIIFYWWLILFGIGVLFLSFVFEIFPKSWDRGWILSKILGVVFLSYMVFLLGTLRLVPFRRHFLLGIVLLFGLLNLAWLRNKNRRKKFLSVLSVHRKIFFLEELLFLTLLVFWSIVRGFQPDIEGLEKFMDFGFVNSILRSRWPPPQDMWFAGEPINYYYFGHLQAAVLTKLSGLDSALTYNLMVATIFAFAFTAAFSLASNLIFLSKTTRRRVAKAIIGGLISALLLSLGGNLHTIVYVLKDGADKYWYPDATRFIGYQPNNPKDKTIHEFPSYSFVVSDLHAHMNDIPVVLLFLSLLFFVLFEISRLKKKKIPPELWFKFGILGFLLAVMYMTNSWDLPIYTVLFLLTMGLSSLISKRKIDFEYLLFMFKPATAVLILAFVFALPFSIFFKPMSQGIGFVRAHSLWWQLLILWGFFWFLTLCFWWFWLKERRGGLTVSDFFVLGLTIWATVLIFIPEVIYVKDIYIPEYHRANTMFKLVYQSFIMYTLASGYIGFRLKNKLRGGLLTGFLVLFLLGFFSQMLYPVFAIKGYYGVLAPSRYRGIYGMGFLKRKYPDDYQGVFWLKKNIGDQPVVLEAPGDSYTLYNRVSAMTGLPTIQGWLVHEWLWRGGYEQVGKRVAQVEAIFQGKDDDYAKRLLKMYRVEYVFVGSLERKKYPALDERRFQKWGKVVFSSGMTKIYRLSFLD